jgi:hypothetical protein
MERHPVSFVALWLQILLTWRSAPARIIVGMPARVPSRCHTLWCADYEEIGRCRSRRSCIDAMVVRRRSRSPSRRRDFVRHLEDNDDEPACTTKIRARPRAPGRTP